MRTDSPGVIEFVGWGAVTMSLGWGLRGYIGGGPLGAMIPGAMMALLLASQLRLRGRRAALLAAFGAVGIGFGGQMTYGQTIGFLSDDATLAWGLTGLTMKGAIWGLLGGAVIGLALSMPRVPKAVAAAALVVMPLGTWAGWAWINEPKLIYFSNRLDRPRPEIWAGLLIGALLLLAVLAWKGAASLPARFGLLGLLGGGVGFGVGGAILAAGRRMPPELAWQPWWKYMEFTFGACLGAAIGWAAWQARTAVPPAADDGESPSPWLVSLAWTAVFGALPVVGEMLPGMRFGFTVTGALVLLALLHRNGQGAQLAVTATSFAFFVDMAEHLAERSMVPLPVGIAGAVAASLGMWALTRRIEAAPDFAPRALILLTATAVVDSLVKSVTSEWSVGHALVEAIFVSMALALLWRFRPASVGAGVPR